MITLDTSGLIAVFATQERYHEAAARVLEHDPGPYIIPTAVFSEMCFMIESEFPPDIEQAFFDDLRAGAYTLDWRHQDLERIQELTRKYQDLALGFADAAVITCAERNRGRVLSIDFRHFPIVARGERTIEVLPQEQPR